jgi:tetratricopeptide (TPR) repeat protein
VLVAACSRQPPDPALRQVRLPDLSRVDTAVQAQMREGYAALQAVSASDDASAADRGQAYGRIAMLLHAAEYYEAAEPAYLNAQALMATEARWPYYLAHLYKSQGQRDRSMAAFTRVLDLRPDDVPALIWLGRMHLDQGDGEMALALFERARALAPRQVAVLAGLGQAALAQRDFTRAAALLQEALAADPSAASLHSPLAMAYRGLGERERADEHLTQWRNTEILVPDPLRLELDLALDSALSFELRGVRALEARDFEAAAGFFRRGGALAPAGSALGRSLGHKLGTALYLAGDLDAAVDQFNEVVRAAPDSGPDETAARAHYSLGVLRAAAGRSDEAVRHLAAAVRYSPHYVEALQALGDQLRRSGRHAEAMTQYVAVLRIDPRAADARFGQAMALVRLRRYREARDALAEAMRLHPGRDDFMHATARLLAAAPDSAVRDGVRAMTLVDRLLGGPKTVALGETTAMALAETGRFSEAAAVQRQVMKAAREAGLAIDLDRMTATLRLYEQRRPCRIPWTDDDPIHHPVPPALQQAAFPGS